MPLSKDAEQVLRDILAVGSERGLGIGRRLRAPTPGPSELFDFCELIAKGPQEEEIQRFLEERIGFITGLLGGPDNADLAVLFKPPLGNRYVADFCVLQAHQGGAVVHLLEIETSHEKLFTKQGRPASRLASALTQVEDWSLEISKNPLFFSNDLIRIAQDVPILGESAPNSRGVRFTDPDRIQNYWRDFGGYEAPHFTYTVIAGRWSKLSKQDKARIIDRNRHAYPKVHTFEQVARNANFRLERDDWHNELNDWTDPKSPNDWISPA